VTRNRIARLHPDGSLDTGFDPDANSNVYSMAAQADGKILVGGNFTAIGGAPRNRIARLTNTDAAIQELSVSRNGYKVTWMRGQASPEVWRVTFEHSADGVTWSSLGSGTRITVGWELTGLSLPINQYHYVRARGYAAGGLYNGSGSLLESVRIFYLKPIGSIVDFDGDWKSDILWRHGTTGSVAMWLMNGATISSDLGVGVVSDLGWQIQEVGDFDGDGKSDILWRHSTSGSVAMWLMNGAAISSDLGVGVVSDLGWQIQDVGDFNGDTKADILWRHATTGSVAMWLMNGAAISSDLGVGVVSDLGWQIQEVGDFDGDGKSDILWRHSTSGMVAMWLMNGATISSDLGVGVVSDLGWQIQEAGDFNGDTKADILWRHATTGSVAMWLMNGAAISSDLGVGVVSDLGWQIMN
jgi:hypothetical protein